MASSRVPSSIPYLALSSAGMVVCPFLVTTTSVVVLHQCSTCSMQYLSSTFRYPTLGDTIRMYQKKAVEVYSCDYSGVFRFLSNIIATINAADRVRKGIGNSGIGSLASGMLPQVLGIFS